MPRNYVIIYLRDLSLFVGGGHYIWGEGHYLFERQFGEGHYFVNCIKGRALTFLKHKALPSVSNDFYIRFLILKLMFTLSRDVRTMVLTKHSSIFKYGDNGCFSLV